MESSVSPDSSLSADIQITESAVKETGSWDSENVDDALEFSTNSEKLFEENDIKSSTNLVQIAERDRPPSEEFDEERELKQPADSKDISGEDNDYERSDVPKLPEDYVADETIKEDEKMLQADDDLTKAEAKNTSSENISSEVINGDCCEDKDGLHQSGNSEGIGQMEEDVRERTESVQNGDSVMGIPIQDSEHELLVAKSVESHEVAEQKSVENTASDTENVDGEDIARSSTETEGLSIHTKSDNYESVSREGQAADDVKQIQESSHDAVLEPVRTPEDSFLEPASTLESDSFLEPASTPESDSLLALRNTEDHDPDSTEHASLTIPESDSSSIFRNGKDVLAESAEEAKFIYTDTDEIFNQPITSIVEPLGKPFHVGETGDTGAIGEDNLESEVMDTEAIGEQNSKPEVEGRDVCCVEEHGEEPKEMTETDHGLTKGTEENFSCSAKDLPEVDGTGMQEMEDNPKTISNTIGYEEDSSVESGAKNDGEDSKIVEPEPLNVAAGDQTYNDKSNVVEIERSVVAESENRDQQSESEIQIQANENMALISHGSTYQNPEGSGNSRGMFLRRIWHCCGVLEWMRNWQD